MNVQELAAKYKTSTVPSAIKNNAPMSVSALADKYKNYQVPPPPPISTPKSFASKFFGGALGIDKKASDVIGDVGTGIDKSIVGQVQNLGQLIGKGSDKLGITKGAGNATFLQDPNALQPKGAAQDTGDIIGTIAPYFTGVGEEEGASKIAELIPKIAEHIGADTSSFGTKVATYLAKKAPSVVKNTAIGTAQTGNLKQGAEQGLIGEAISDVSAVPKVAKSVLRGARSKIAEGSVPLMKGLDTQIKTSAKRLQSAAPLRGAGAALQKPLLEVYNDFADQESKHIADVKEDPAISTVGSRIGDAFKSVVKMRQDAGKVMSSELDKIGKKTTDVKNAFGKFQNELLSNGATFDSVKKELTTGSDSKFGSSDKQVLEKYASELQELGSKPNVKELDAFIGRIPNEIKALKASKGITFKTNAERLISNNMNDLRDSLAKSGTPEYNAARKTYSNLSSFIKEGAPFLGKVTQSGDFAKDASLAKSSVQSVLNNGKKDWLIKLENHTGYPALDESILALKAMEDAGDAKGSSLLKLISDNVGKGDWNPSGTIGKGIQILGMGAKRMIEGSPAEQTRAYLKSLGR